MLQTALHEWHVAAGGRMVDFAGWHMPIQYTTITEEHHAVRQRAGLFDIAHMGRIWFRGPERIQFLDSIVTNHVGRIKDGHVRYSLVCNEQGGILDDILIYRFPEECLLVVNGANREKIVAWLEAHRGGVNVEISDDTLDSFMLALQGPQAQAILQPHVDGDLAELRYYRSLRTTAFGVDAVVSRTGYTGEDGFELIVSNDAAVKVWETLMEAGQSAGLVACGLGCRDTLRLEAAMPLYGHEMDESTDPFTAGLAFGVKLDKPGFIGKQALLELSAKSDRPQRVGLQLEGKRIAREGAQLLKENQPVGRVTSGTFSPTLERAIAMGYVTPECATPGTRIEVDIRGRQIPAAVVELPFYKR